MKWVLAKAGLCSIMMSGCAPSNKSVSTHQIPTALAEPTTTALLPEVITLWDGTDTSQLVMARGGPCRWKVQGEDLIVAAGTGDLVSAHPLGSGHYHVEWLSPPGGSRWRQRNGNSGVKIASRYELQILNSPGPEYLGPLPDDEAGSIYAYRAPDVNASNQPGTWQTYDIHYTAPIWSDGIKKTDARLTVYWNGVLIHDDVAITTQTGASDDEGSSPQPLLLQDHASTTDPVRFRNIWFRPEAQRNLDRIRDTAPTQQ